MFQPVSQEPPTPPNGDIKNLYLRNETFTPEFLGLGLLDFKIEEETSKLNVILTHGAYNMEWESLSMHPDRGIVRMDRRSDGIYTRPNVPKTLTH